MATATSNLTFDQAAALDLGTEVRLSNGWVALVGRSYDCDRVEDMGVQTCDEIRFTADGSGQMDLDAWHDGEADDDDWVYVEVWRRDGSGFHGYIHRRTRRVIQAG